MWNAITALGTWFLVIGTLIAVYIQKHQSKLINSANTIITYHDRFESSIMKDKRKILAEILITKKDIVQEDILIFFETMGCLTRRKVLTNDMVWNEFSWVVIRYYIALTKFTGIDYIDKLRKDNKDITLYSDFEWLYNCLIKLDMKKRKVGQEIVIPNNIEIEKFLKEEMEKMPTSQ
jgi:hypothetical protein